jgi:type VI secretion system FHA domain protein
MILLLEATGAEASRLGSASGEFSASGGTIGRDKQSQWVLPHSKVSGCHAVITFSHGTFHIEDKSRNGVFLNSPRNRLERGRPYPLKSGDRLYIDPYVIHVTVTSSRESSPEHHSSPEDYASEPAGQRGHCATPPLGSARRDTHPEMAPGEEVDPLKLLDPALEPPPVRQTPSVRDLERGSPMAGHYKPPAVPPPPPVTPLAGASLIPADYDPMSPDEPFEMPIPTPRSMPAEEPPPLVEALVLPETPRQVTPDPPRRVTPQPPRPVTPSRRPLRPETPLPEPSPDADEAPPPHPDRSASTRDFDESDLAAVLSGAGLEDVAVTPELARDFGRIFRVVVEGVMDVLRSRQQIKDEFRMRLTQFRPADNNPLKFSANIDDALHNLLVKRNAAYLTPVEAFEDAFDDLRHHQIAMLAGMRVAFESMLAAFEPDHLQQDFDRQLKRGSLLGMTAKLRYWDLYCDQVRAMAKDSETSFRKLFGEAFARAYEEQLTRLKAEGRSLSDIVPPEK